MRRAFFYLAALCGLLAFPHSGRSAEPGIRTLQIPVAHRRQPLQVELYFPTLPDGQLVEVGANPLFVGAPMRNGATPEPGRHPLVLLSHGSGGNAANLAWLGAALAREGFVVVAPNHRGTTSRRFPSRRHRADLGEAGGSVRHPRCPARRRLSLAHAGCGERQRGGVFARGLLCASQRRRPHERGGLQSLLRDGLAGPAADLGMRLAQGGGRPAQAEFSVRERHARPPLPARGRYRPGPRPRGDRGEPRRRGCPGRRSSASATPDACRRPS